MTKLTREQIRQTIGEAVGEASMCWDPRPGHQVFDSTQASFIVDRLVNLFEEVQIGDDVEYCPLHGVPHMCDCCTCGCVELYDEPSGAAGGDGAL